jgi:hypothetical protein
MYDWVRNSYSESSDEPKNLTIKEENEICELKCDLRLKKRFIDLSLYMFRMTVKEDCPVIHNKAIYRL